MISQNFITEWRSHAPWVESFQVEQDLVISKALVQIFSNPFLQDAFAFRGGTALQKLVFSRPHRYSEDIDLVQVRKEPIGKTLDHLRELLDPWLGKPRVNFKDARVTLIYRFQSEVEPIIPLRLKVEINTGEHFMVLNPKRKLFRVQSSWFQGQAEVLIYETEELLGTKLRALYQRKKGRDLYDMSMAILHLQKLDYEKVIQCFQEYMKHQGVTVTRAQYESNLHNKLSNSAFTEDILPLLASETSSFNPHSAADLVIDNFVALLPGDPWKSQSRGKK